MSNYLTFSVILFFLILCGPTTFGHRSLSSSSTSPSDLNLISDGVHNRDSRWSYLALNRLTAESSTCDQTYGFLPCTTTVIGNIFLIAVYGYLMFLAASYLSHGSELLLEILGPGIIGGLFLPILGALPDAMLILVSGLSGTTETAQSQVSIGMGLLAGSTVMLLTVLQPWIQRRKIAYVKHKHVILGVLRHLKQHALGRLLGEDGSFIQLMQIMMDNISATELRAFIVGIQFDGIDLDLDVAVDKIMKDIDTSHNSCIEKEEFVDGISRWLNKTKRAATRVAGPHTMTKDFDNFHKETKREHDLLDVGVQSDEVIESVESSKRTTIKAVLLLLLGTIIAACFADPLVDAVDNFSDATSIPAFFISFIALPLATNSSEAVSAIIFASRDKRRTASLTFSELYGAATMNNLLCLSVFLALIYIRGLTWDFSAEVLVILIVCIVMGSFASFRTHFPLWTSIVAFLLYPFSLALIYVLDYVLGWS
uniref:EF-hand domain-containing protein n=1 Tax=Fagus sylvatica TaxID=28930 RepID=A0A2N9J4Q0_FAGSY